MSAYDPKRTLEKKKRRPRKPPSPVNRNIGPLADYFSFSMSFSFQDLLKSEGFGR
jgi:hypothetical protein